MPRIIPPSKEFAKTFVLANGDGTITFEGRGINPYTFQSTFLIGDRSRGFEEEHVPNGYECKRKLSEQMKEQAMHIRWDPLERISLRRSGLEFPDVSWGELLCYEDKKTRQKGELGLGYFFWLEENETLKNLDKAHIHYRVIERVPYGKIK